MDIADFVGTSHRRCGGKCACMGSSGCCAPPSLTSSSASTSTQSNASGGGAPCVTAGDTRAKRGGTRGGSGQRTLRRRRRRTESVEGNSDVQKWAAVRHRRCRRFALSSVHGFALRASPAVKHGVSPPGTVGDNVERVSA